MKRFRSFLPLLLFAVLLVTGLAACDSTDQNYDYTPGESLIGLSGPSAVDVPNGEATFTINPFTVSKDYDWSVEGPGDVELTERRDGEFIDLTFDEPGTYTVTVDDGEYAGETTFEASYPNVVDQADRFGFGNLGAALDVAGLLDTLDTEGPFTVFAPTDEAFVNALDTTASGALDLPADSVLADILSYHVLSGEFQVDDLGNSRETLEGGALMFDGDQVIDGTDLTGPATITDANVPAGNGLVHGIDALRLPPTASVAFGDQEIGMGDTVTVPSVYIPRDGYVAIHDSTLLDGNVAGSVIGVSDYLEAGIHNDVSVDLFDVPGLDVPADTTLPDTQLLIAMPHEETSGNMAYNFLTSGGSEDGAYVEDGEAVTDAGTVTVPESDSDDGSGDDGSDDGDDNDSD